LRALTREEERLLRRVIRGGANRDGARRARVRASIAVRFERTKSNTFKSVFHRIARAPFSRIVPVHHVKKSGLG